MAEECQQCGSHDFVRCTDAGESVCRDCGCCGHPVYYDGPAPTPKGPSKVQVGIATGVLRTTSALGRRERGVGAYDPRYYWNERFRQTQNRDPRVSLADLRRIALPLYESVPGFTEYQRKREPDLTRDDIAALCKRAGLSKHAEKWIQIKYRLCNFHLYTAEEAGMAPCEDDDDSETDTDTDSEPDDGAGEWKKKVASLNVWEPDFIPDKLVVQLKACLRLVKNAFFDAQEFLEEYPFLKPYKRTSLPNFDFLVARFLFMLCPCGNHSHSPDCYYPRYSWMLKKLSTKNNIKTHVAWWYFLVGSVQRNTLYSHPEIPNEKWVICPEDELIVSPVYAPKCPSLLHRALPTLPNPALQCLQLKSCGPRYLRLYPRGRQTVTSCEEKSPRPTSELCFWWESP